MWNQFDSSIQHCHVLKQLENLIRLGKNCVVEYEAPDFELIASTGEKIALPSLGERYVFIDFGAFGCGPYRREIPNFKKVYAEFKDKRLRVVGVSIENSDKVWKKR